MQLEGSWFPNLILNPCLLLEKRGSPNHLTAREEPGTDLSRSVSVGATPLSWGPSLSPPSPLGQMPPRFLERPPSIPASTSSGLGPPLGGEEKSMGKSSVIAFELGMSGALGRGWGGCICISLAGLRP